MSKKVIEIMKMRMTLEERKLFVKNCEKSNGVDWWKKLDGKVLSANDQGLFYAPNSFRWSSSKEGMKYWGLIRFRFTNRELQAKINLNEFIYE